MSDRRILGGLIFVLIPFGLGLYGYWCLFKTESVLLWRQRRADQYKEPAKRILFWDLYFPRYAIWRCRLIGVLMMLMAFSIFVFQFYGFWFATAERNRILLRWIDARVGR